jgi:DNA modification methylase
MTKRIKWHVEKRVVSELVDYDKNPRIITEIGLRELANSFDDIGMAQPININTDNTILSGHARRKQLEKEDACQEVDVYVPDRKLTPKQEETVIIRMNKNVAGSWNFESLQTDFEMDDLLGWGFEENDFESVEPEVVEGLTDDDAVPELKKDPITKKGDVWLLGHHRLMCGSSTDLNDVEKLMDGQKANIMFTSPPYNAGNEVKVGKTAHKYEEHKDDLSTDGYVELLTDFTTNALMFSDMAIVNIQQLAGNKIAFIEWLNLMKENFVDVAIWNKSHGPPMLPKRVMNCAFEYLLFFSNEPTPPRTIKTAPMFHGNIQNVYNGPKQTNNEYAKIHKATFPVHLPEFIIKNFSTGSVIDLFNGTGTTLIACEKLSRKYFGMDMDPLYIDATVSRWEQFTCKKAELLNGSV